MTSDPGDTSAGKSVTVDDVAGAVQAAIDALGLGADVDALTFASSAGGEKFGHGSATAASSSANTGTYGVRHPHVDVDIASTAERAQAEAFLAAAAAHTRKSGASCTSDRDKAQAEAFVAAASSAAAQRSVSKFPGTRSAKDSANGLNIHRQKWSETFWMMQRCGLVDRGNTYALTVATLKRKGDDIQESLDALRTAEGNLIKAAKGEIDDALRLAEGGGRPSKPPRDSKRWGVALADAVILQALERAVDEAEDEPPFCATELVCEAESAVAQALEAHREAQKEADERSLAEAQQALMLQAEAVAQAQAIAEEQTKALEQARAQAEIVAQAQALLHLEAAAAQEQQAEAEAALVERNALRAQGLNSKKLPLRPGVPACSYFLRKQECKYGRTCKWDHPEVAVNSKGYPIRHGETPCAFYLRTGICKFSSTCKFDHPENIIPTHPMPSAALAVTVPPSAPMANLGVSSLDAQLAALMKDTPGLANGTGPTVVARADANTVSNQQVNLAAVGQTAALVDESKLEEPLSEQQEQLLKQLLHQAQQEAINSLTGTLLPAVT